MSDDIEFTDAKRENVSLLISLAGASGSGKTFSALRLAYGISPAGKIAFIDTEARRGLHYSDRFKFKHWDMRPPFPPARFVEAIDAAERAGFEVLVIDSFSHEHDGEGGLIDMADAAEKAGTKSPGNWRVPKMEHKKLVNRILQCRLSVVFCLRADEKIRIEKDPETRKTIVTPMGWMPICEKRFAYEMTVSFTLTADRPGRPNFNLPHKCQDQHLPMFPEGELIGEDAGRQLAAWARGDAPAGPDPAEVAKAIANGNAAAQMSTMEPLREVWTKLSPEVRRAIGGAAKLAEWKKLVEANTKEGENAGP